MIFANIYFLVYKQQYLKKKDWQNWKFNKFKLQIITLNPPNTTTFSKIFFPSKLAKQQPFAHFNSILLTVIFRKSS